MLADLGLQIDDLDAVFLTHEHGDHATGVEGLCKKSPKLRVFANQATAEAIQRGSEMKIPWSLFETGTRFAYKGLEVDSFSVPHDAAEPVGFLFRWGGGDLFSPRRSLAWLTDLGYAPDSLGERVADAEALVLEANYCDRLLEADLKRPWSVKQRISGRHGHLSNHAARTFVSSVEKARWEQVFLVHLSRDCNSLQAVDEAFAPLRGSHPRLSVSVIPPGGAGPLIDNL